MRIEQDQSRIRQRAELAPAGLARRDPAQPRTPGAGSAVRRRGAAETGRSPSPGGIAAALAAALAATACGARDRIAVEIRRCGGAPRAETLRVRVTGADGAVHEDLRVDGAGGTVAIGPLPAGPFVVRVDGLDGGGHAVSHGESPAVEPSADDGVVPVVMGPPDSVCTLSARHEARAGHTATLLSDGTVLIAGGEAGGRALASTEVFDPRTLRFSPGPDLAEPRALHAAVALDGEVYLLGGRDRARRLASVERYAPGGFEPAGDLSEPRAAPAAAVLPGGREAVIYGGIAEAGPSAALDVLTPAGVEEAACGDACVPAHGHAAVALAGGAALFFGGHEDTGAPAAFPNCESCTADLGLRRDPDGAAARWLLSSNQIACAGREALTACAARENAGLARRLAAAAVVRTPGGGEIVLVHGGVAAGAQPRVLDHLLLFECERDCERGFSHRFALPLGDPPTGARCGHSLTALRGAAPLRLLLAGGFSGAGGCDLLGDALPGRVTAAGPALVIELAPQPGLDEPVAAVAADRGGELARGLHAAVRLTTGAVLITGGLGEGGALDTAALFLPAPEDLP